MRYRLARSFNPDSHSQGVTQVVFAPSSTLLATSDLGGKLCIWDTGTGNLVHHYTPGTSILSLIWANTKTVFCGLGDGTVVELHLGKDEVNVLGSWCHAYPVEHLSLARKCLASGAHSELFIWKVSERDGDHSGVEKEIRPPVKPDGEDVVVTGLHWTSLHKKDILVVAYMSHGVYLYETANWTVLRTIGESALGVMARSGLSPDGSRIVVSNLLYGFDIYDTDTGALVHTITHKVGREYPAPVSFIHGGRAVMGGSTVGVVNIWYLLDDLLPKKMQTLPVAGGDRVLSFDAHYNPQTDQFLIAAGVMDGKSSVCLWKAEEVQATDTSRSARHTNEQRLFRTIYNAMFALDLSSLANALSVTLSVLGTIAAFLLLVFGWSGIRAVLGL